MDTVKPTGNFTEDEKLVNKGLDAVAKKIKEQRDNIAEIYWYIYVAASNILSEALGEEWKQGTAVDIREVAKYYELAIVENEMHSNRNFFKNEVMGFVDIYDENEENRSGNGTIYINQDLGDLSKRYVIAHEIAHYYFRENGEGHENCIKMLFPKTVVEQLCDIMAAFLLMPIETVLKLLKKYLDMKNEEGACPVYAEDCLKYLGYELKISDFQVALCYQHVLCLGGILREKGAEKNAPGVFVNMEEYKKLLC